MNFQALRRSDVNSFELFSVPEGTVRFHHIIAEELGIVRNDIIQIIHKDKVIFRRIFLSRIIEKDKIVIDYDSLKELEIDDGYSHPFEIDIRKIRKFSFCRFALNNPNMTERVAFRLGMIGLIAGIISVLLGVLAFFK